MRFKGWLILVPWLAVLACNRGRDLPQQGTFHPESERFWEVVPGETRVERIGIGFQFTEGPAWHPGGILIFSDIPANTIYKWTGRKYRPFRKPSNQANGLWVEPGGSVLACEHGSRSITRYTLGGKLEVLAGSYKGRKFNSPNDLCRASDGTIYFTDPPYGLPGRNEDPEKELPYNGVYMLSGGEVVLIDSTLSWPNGIGMSPDERFLYVANTEYGSVRGEETTRVFWMRYRLDEQGFAIRKKIFFTAPDPSLPGGADGLAVDGEGNLFLTGPGGILVVDPSGAHLGTIGLPTPPSNVAFGPKEKLMYVTARSFIFRIRFI